MMDKIWKMFLLMIFFVLFNYLPHSAKSLPVETTQKPTSTSLCKAEENPSEDPCSPCHCDERSGEWYCRTEECNYCVDGYNKPGQCCLVCPNGPNCDIEGFIVPVGKSRKKKNGEICTCEQRTFYPEVFCPEPTPSYY